MFLHSFVFILDWTAFKVIYGEKSARVGGGVEGLTLPFSPAREKRLSKQSKKSRQWKERKKGYERKKTNLLLLKMGYLCTAYLFSFSARLS